MTDADVHKIYQDKSLTKLEKARKILGDEVKDLTDEQLAEELGRMDQLVEVITDVAIKDLNEKKQKELSKEINKTKQP